MQKAKRKGWSIRLVIVSLICLAMTGCEGCEGELEKRITDIVKREKGD